LARDLLGIRRRLLLQGILERFIDTIPGVYIPREEVRVA
jgi:hypothetical protein